MKKDSLGDRMKRYENITQTRLINRTPVVMRLDGKAFHTFTRGLNRPFDEGLSDAMARTALHLCGQVQGTLFAYTQSDEISILIQDWATFDTDAWFDNKIQKMVSVAASHATAYFNSIYKHPKSTSLALFDARVFNLPFEEVANYFVWRQQDATRNSIQMLAQSQFSHGELQGKNVNAIQDMLMLQKGINWNDTPTKFKRGTCAGVEIAEDDEGYPYSKIQLDYECPIFTQDRDYIERRLTHHADLERQEAAAMLAEAQRNAGI